MWTHASYTQAHVLLLTILMSFMTVLNTMARACMTYHNINALGQHLGPEICGLLPAFHIITGSAYTQPVLEDQCSKSSNKTLMESHHDTPPVKLEFYAIKLQSERYTNIHISDEITTILEFLTIYDAACQYHISSWSVSIRNLLI